MTEIFQRRVNKFSYGLLLGLLSLNLSQFRSYGITTDEPYMRFLGAQAAKYVVSLVNVNLLNSFSNIPLFDKIPDYLSSPDVDHGVIFEFPLLLLESLLRISDHPQLVWQMRHFITFLYCSFAILVVFRFMCRKYQSIGIAILGALMLVLSPRTFADSFYNVKDAVFMSAYIIATVRCIYLLERPSKVNAVISGIACAFAIAIRPAAIIVPCCISLLIALQILFLKGDRYKIPMVVFLSVTVLSSYVMWPYLWTNPFPRFLGALFSLSNYSWTGLVLTNGKYLLSTNLPWYYIPVWISVTVPLAYLIIILCGLFYSLLTLIRNFRNPNLLSKIESLADGFLFMTVIFPLGLAIFANSTLYDGWRHLYFVYPAMIVLGISFLVDLMNRKARIPYLRPALVLCIVSSLSFNAFWMFQNRPLQNVYFNALAGRDVREKWEMDYWGAANYQALRKILEIDSRPRITIASGSSTELFRSANLLSTEESRRLVFKDDWSKADYLVTNYRGVVPPNNLRYEKQFALIYEKYVGEANVYSIFKSKRDL